MNVALAKTETGRAVNSVFTVARDRLPGSGKVADVRRQAFEAYERAACRTAGSRNGNIPTCAR